MSFLIIEAFQFFIGLGAVIISYFLIVRHRRPMLEMTFRDNEKIRNSFESLTSMGYFMIFVPLLLFGINISQSIPYNMADHIQRIIYFEAGLMFLIGMLHFAVISIFTSKIKN